MRHDQKPEPEYTTREAIADAVGVVIFFVGCYCLLLIGYVMEWQ